MKRARSRKDKKERDAVLKQQTEEQNNEKTIEEIAEDFAVPEEDFAVLEEEDNEEPEAAEVENEISDENITESEEGEEEVPFAVENAGDFEEKEEHEEEKENTEEENTPVHSEEYLKRKEMNRKKAEKKKKRKRITTICICAVLLILIAGGVILGMDFSGEENFDDEFVPVDTETGKLNILLLGVDKDGERSDSIMLVSYDFDDNMINLMSIPRDTKMYVTDRAVTRKITEVHGMHDNAGNMYGAAAVAEAVSSLTGIPINYYLEFTFDALDNVMNILGPVTFDVPDIEGNGKGMNYDDDIQDLHIHLQPGLQDLEGNQIQQFLRYRKSNYGTSDGSDISRVGRQQELLKAIIDQKVNLELIIKAPDLFKEVKSQLKTNFSASDIIKYAVYLKNISSENMVTHVLPGESVLSGAWYFVCDFPQTAELVNTNFGYPVTAEELTNQISLTGKTPSGASKQGSKTKQTSSGGTAVKKTAEKKAESSADDDENTESTDKKETTEKTTDTQSVKTTDKTTDKSAGKASDKTADKQSEKTSDKTADKTTEKTPDKTSEKTAEKSSDNQTDTKQEKTPEKSSDSGKKETKSSGESDDVISLDDEDE